MTQAHVNDSISIYYDTETNKYTHETGIFGIYKLQPTLINGRKYYKKDKYCISWDGGKFWYISLDRLKGKSGGFACLEKDVQNLHNTSDWKMREKVLKGRGKIQILGDWRGKMLRVKGR